MSKRRRVADSQESEPPAGIGQLTLAEHSLCPLHTAVSLQPNLVHESEFFYMGPGRQLSRGHARVTCPLGLLASDELFLWGLLGLTLAQPNVDGQLYATPHYCLRQLGLIDQNSRRGGRQYRQFAEALERLSVVSYRNDAFYDPVRKEHRKVSFRFLSYSLPLDPASSRVWRLVWDPLFIELVQPIGGHLLFDLEAYRGLDPASRRLFLLLSKMFWRRTTTPRFELRHLGVDVLGFSSELADRELRRKLTRCIHRLAELDAVEAGDDLFESTHGRCTLRLRRGSYFRRSRSRHAALSLPHSALFEPLRAIGFEQRSIGWLIRTFPVTVLREWADITLAARERKGEGFFRKSAQAWFVDNVRHAAAGTRTPPDWWQEMHREERRVPQSDRRRDPERAISPGILSESSDRLREIVQQHIDAARRV